MSERNDNKLELLCETKYGSE